MEFTSKRYDFTDKDADYASLAEELSGLLAEERDIVANAANTAALLFDALPDINWAGFYFLRPTGDQPGSMRPVGDESGSMRPAGDESGCMRPAAGQSDFPRPSAAQVGETDSRRGADRAVREELVVGPFQGKPACVRIPLGKGVCGAAAATRRTLVVPDVHAFPGHIACDAASRSEIVVPLVKGDRLLGVLDIDSPRLSRFDDADRRGIERLAVIFVDSSAEAPLRGV